MKLQREKPVRLECHGGPMDGDWVSVEVGKHEVIVSLGPEMADPRVLGGQIELDQVRPEVRKGRYLVQGYRPRSGSNRYQQVLRWEGEL